MKKLMSIFGAALFVFSLSSCGGDDAAETETKETNETNETNETEEVVTEVGGEETSEVTQEEVKSDAGSEWDEFLNEYESWMDEYISVIKKMQDNPTDMSLMLSSADLAQDAMKWAEKMEGFTIGTDGWTSEHSARYLEIASKALNAISY